jgi:hypothetical protein
MANPGDWSLRPGRQLASGVNTIGHLFVGVIRHPGKATIAHPSMADFLSPGLLEANSRKERAVGRFWTNPNDVPTKDMYEVATTGSAGPVAEALKSA